MHRLSGLHLSMASNLHVVLHCCYIRFLEENFANRWNLTVIFTSVIPKTTVTMVTDNVSVQAKSLNENFVCWQ